MAIPRFADPQHPDVRLTEQVVTRPSSHDEDTRFAVNPSAGFRPYTYRAPRREGLVPLVPKGA